LRLGGPSFEIVSVHTLAPVQQLHAVAAFSTTNPAAAAVATAKLLLLLLAVLPISTASVVF